MATPRLSDISRSFGPLREVVLSLARSREGEIPAGVDRRRVVRQVRSAGNAAVPTLVRALGSDSEHEASWAYHLLSRLGGPRVVSSLQALLAGDAPSDEVKARALGLLSDLQAPMPRTVTLRD